MNNLDDNSEKIKEAKKFSLEKKIDIFGQLILLRYQSLTTISSISFAVVGISLAVRSELIKNEQLALMSLLILTATALFSLGRHLYLLRGDITNISQQIKNLPTADWSKPLKQKDFGADWWPEILYLVFIIGVILFGLSLLHCPVSRPNDHLVEHPLASRLWGHGWHGWGHTDRVRHLWF